MPNSASRLGDGHSLVGFLTVGRWHEVAGVNGGDMVYGAFTWTGSAFGWTGGGSVLDKTPPVHEVQTWWQPQDLVSCRSADHCEICCGGLGEAAAAWAERTALPQSSKRGIVECT